MNNISYTKSKHNDINSIRPSRRRAQAMDVYLTGSPQITHFKTINKNHSICKKNKNKSIISQTNTDLDACEDDDKNKSDNVIYNAVYNAVHSAVHDVIHDAVNDAVNDVLHNCNQHIVNQNNTDSNADAVDYVSDDTNYVSDDDIANVVDNKSDNIDNKTNIEKEDLFLKKLSILRKLGELKQCGVHLSQDYNIDSDINAMEYEYKLHCDIQAKTNWVQYMSSMLKLSAKGLKMLNDLYDPLGIKLNGFTEAIDSTVDSSQDVLGKIYDKYNTSCKQKPMSPELKLLMTISAAALSNQLMQSRGNYL
jgi:hypothetical protein